MKLLYPQSREEWLKIRKGYISSTESSALFGRSPYHTAYEIGVMKRRAEDATDQDLVGTERTSWGRRLQDAIAQGVADDYGVRVEGLGFTYAVDDEARMGSSFDYTIVGARDEVQDTLSDMYRRLGPGLLEIKNVDSLEFKRKWVDDEAPEHIEIQLQHQLEVFGLSWGAIAALVGGNTTRLVIRERDLQVGKIIRNKIAAFWSDFDNGVLPDPLMPDDAAIMIALYQYAEPNKVFDGQDNEQLKDLVQVYRCAAQNQKLAQAAKSEAKAHILQLIGDSEKAIVQGATIHAAMRAPSHIEAYDRKGFRDFRIFEKK